MSEAQKFSSIYSLPNEKPKRKQEKNLKENFSNFSTLTPGSLPPRFNETANEAMVGKQKGQKYLMNQLSFSDYKSE